MTTITEKITTALKPLASFDDPLGNLLVSHWDRIRRTVQADQKRPARIPPEHPNQEDVE